MEIAGHGEQATDVAVAGLRPEPANCNEVVSVPAVFPATLFGDGLEDLDSGAPALFGGLGQVAVGQFPLVLVQINNRRSWT